MWDLTTALDQYHASLSFPNLSLGNQANAPDKTAGTVSTTTTTPTNASAMLFANRVSDAVRQVIASFTKKKTHLFRTCND